jgi:hypothetical protein
MGHEAHGGPRGGGWLFKPMSSGFDSRTVHRLLVRQVAAVDAWVFESPYEEPTPREQVW